MQVWTTQLRILNERGVSMLEDRHGRRFPYLRLSVTDVCNFRCSYCLPNGYQKSGHANGFLSLGEIENLVRAFAERGCQKIRLTGGEPTLRRDILDIIRTVKSIDGINTVALSSNGYRLESLAAGLRAAGLAAVNISVDSLNPRRFQELTGQDLLPRVLAGIDQALALGFERVKINAVLMKSSYEPELENFLDWIKGRAVTVRWIELMPTGGNQDFYRQNFISSQSLEEKILARGWLRLPRTADGGPAEEFAHPDYRGRVGLIAPYARNFCQTCNRLRISARGGLRLCLFGDGEKNLRPWLADASQRAELLAVIDESLYTKKVSHELDRGHFGDNQTFSAMGG